MTGRWASLFKRPRTKAHPAAAWAALHAGNLELASDLLARCRADQHDAREMARLSAQIRWQRDDVDGATALLEAALDLRPITKAREAFERLRVELQLPAAAPIPRDDAIALNPGRADAAIQKAAQLLRQLAPDSVQDCVAVASEAHPENAPLQYLRGQLLADAGHWPDAVSAMRTAARMAPTSAYVLHALGKLLARAGQQTEAIDYLELAVHHSPTYAAAWIDLLRVLDSADDVDAGNDAARRFDAAIPEASEAAFWVGKFSERRGDLAAAAKAYEHALTLKPDWAPTMTNYGLLLLELGRIPQANQLLAEVARNAPSDPDAKMNLGLALRFAGDLDGALGLFRAALALAPSDAMTRYHLATTHLLRAEFAEGWDHYSARWQQDLADQRRPPGRPWTGDGALHGKHLLIWGEQGLGDQIMFSSCIEEIARQTRTCTIECHPRLKALFRRSFPWCTVVGGNTQGDLDLLASERPYDVHTPMGDLPAIVRRSQHDFPHHTGYLVADEAKRARWRGHLAGLPGRVKIGISWVGGVRQTGRARRSMALSTWAPMLNLAGIDFVSLQYTPCESDLGEVRTTMGVNIRHWQDAIDDLDETAALIAELDAVISVCNTTVHLAGALGKRVWVLTPCVAEWRYLARGESMPWYPSAKLIRQQTPDSWASVIDAITRDLVTEFGHSG